MRALAVVPGKANSIQLDDVPAPPPNVGDMLVQALGICGTDSRAVNSAGTA